MVVLQILMIDILCSLHDKKNAMHKNGKNEYEQGLY
jgi:hypothetical protein